MSIFISLVLFLNVTLLAILVPGGPIENRDFTHLKGSVFWGFNVFLISQGLMTFVNAYFVLSGISIWQPLAIAVAIGYMIVYALDLAKIFPKSPTKMSKALQLLEIINFSVAVYLFILAISQ